MPRKTAAQRRAEAHAAEEAAATARLTIRRAGEYAKWIQGWTQQRIAEHYGISQTTVSEDLRLHRQSITPQTREEMQADHLKELRWLREQMAELIRKEGAPVTAGKDGDIVKDPETGDVVRDFGLRLSATDRWIKIIEREAKQLGTDAAAKVEHSGEVALVGSIAEETAKLEAALGLTAGEELDDDSHAEP